MTAYFIKRLFLMVPTFLVISIIVFVVINLVPGKPGAHSAEHAVMAMGENKNDNWREFERQFDLDKPILFNTRFLISQEDVHQSLMAVTNLYGNQTAARQIDTLTWLNHCGQHIVPQLLQIAADTTDAALRYFAVQLLSQNAQRPVQYRYGTEATDTSQNNEIYRENQQLRKMVFDRDAPTRTQQAIIAQWQDWYAAVKTQRYTPGLGDHLHTFFVETRLAQYLIKLIQFDFGVSYLDKQPVLPKILSRLKYTLLLTIPSLLLAYLLAVPLGIYSALRRDRIGDKVVTTGLFMLYALPGFFVGTLLLLFFSQGSDYFQWFPTGGWHSTDYSTLTTVSKMGDVVWHLALPLFCLTYGSLAVVSRYTRTGLLGVLQEDYIRTARAKGLDERQILLGHGLRNGLLPIITLLATVLPKLIGGSVIVEVIFNIPGMGLLTYDAILNRDYNVVMAVQLIATVLVMFGIFIADICYAAADPRISYK